MADSLAMLGIVVTLGQEVECGTLVEPALTLSYEAGAAVFDREAISRQPHDDGDVYE